MSGGIFDFLTQAAHRVAAEGIEFSEALALVTEAHDEYVAKLDEPCPPTTIGNITYVDFRWRKPRARDMGTL